LGEPDNFKPFGLLLKGFFISINIFLEKKDYKFCGIKIYRYISISLIKEGRKMKVSLNICTLVVEKKE